MIISDKYKCIFIRIPKTGSTSFEKMWKHIDPQCISSNEDKPPYGHYKASELRKIVGEKKWNEYFKCTFIRNPINWFRSQYCYNMLYQHKNNKQLHALLNNEYKLNNPDNKIIDIKDCVFFHVILKEWFNSSNQLNYIDEEINFIGFFEHFNRDVKYIWSHLNINNIPKHIMHVNKSSSKEYSFSDKSLQFLNWVLKKDIVFYNKRHKEKT